MTPPGPQPEKLYNISPSLPPPNCLLLAFNRGKLVWQLADRDCNMFGISMLMRNYRDQSDGEDISLFVNSVMLCLVSTQSI